MKSNKNWLLAATVAATLLQPSDPARASITGQWDFKRGDLTATIGQDLNYGDPVTQAGTKFGTTASFGIPGIGGVSTNVMMFPQTSVASGGYVATTGAAGNGGGSLINQYTVIMDVLYPTNSSFLPRALFVSDEALTEFMADQNNAIGFSGGAFDGVLTPNTWHRVAVTVDTTTGGTISKYIDGVQAGTAYPTPGGVDGPYSIIQQLFLFDDANTNSQPGFIASLQFRNEILPPGFIAGLGAPAAGGILTGPPPNPYLISESPSENLQIPGRSVVPPNPQVQIVLSDGATTVNTNTIQLKFDGTVVAPSIVKTGLVTTITYNVTSLLAPGSLNTVALTYQDSGANALGTQYSFYVISSFAALPASAAGPLSSASTNGFIFHMVQAPSEAVGVFLQDDYVRAEQQLDGTLLNTNGVAFTNEAVLGPNPDGGWFIDQYAAANEGASDVIAFGVSLSSLTALPAATILPFPGIPGVNGSTLNFADETLTYLSLTAGTYVFGVDVGVDRVDSPPGADDGYALFCGANPRDQFSTLVGQFARTAGNFGITQNTNQFTFIAPVTGIYPFRLVHWQNNLGSNLAWYSVDPVSGQFILINDPTDARSIKAFRVSNILREPYVAEVYPAPAAQGVPANAPITVILGDDDITLNTNSVKFFLNGAAVTPAITKNGKFTTAAYNPNATRTTVTNTVELVYADSSAEAKFFTNTWAFTIVLQSSGGAQVTGQWDFKNGDLSATVGAPLAYLGGAGGDSATKTTFGTTGAGAFASIPGINGVPTTILNPGGAATADNNYGLIMQPNISPNGGGNLVNQYTIIMDFYYPGGTETWFNCQNTNNTTDGSIFIQGGDIGQGSGGYTMLTPLSSGAWHRIALSVDLAAGVIYKYADGVIQNVWAQTGLDLARRAWQQDVLLFADGDGDDKSQIYVSSVQVRNGAMTTNELVALGGPDAGKIPVPNITAPPPPVTGQWDFKNGDLSATIGAPLTYLGGTSGDSATKTTFGTTTSFDIPGINGVATTVVDPGGAATADNNYGLIMQHNISPNGGGKLVNEYTIIMDFYYPGGTETWFNCQNTNNTTDGSIFIQGGDIGQGSGGYTMVSPLASGAWHRIALSVDLAGGVITKYGDGIIQNVWTQTGLDLARRAWQPDVLLFADGDGDDKSLIYVSSVQVRGGAMTQAQLLSLGGPSAGKIPIDLGALVLPTVTAALSGQNALALTFPTTAAGYILQSSPSLISPVWTTVPGVVSNSVTITIPPGAGMQFYRLAQ